MLAAKEGPCIVYTNLNGVRDANFKEKNQEWMNRSHCLMMMMINTYKTRYDE
jgi:hypothetical protein